MKVRQEGRANTLLRRAALKDSGRFRERWVVMASKPMLLPERRSTAPGFQELHISILICFGFTSSFLGSSILRMPSLIAALILVESMLFVRLKDRVKVPYPLSILW